MLRKNKKYDVVISGMGPAGLAAAYEALQAGKSVLLISNRPNDFVRVQSVFLTPPMREYLMTMLKSDGTEIAVADKKFKDSLQISIGISIKEIERFIKRRIDAYSSASQLTCYYESQLKSIDFTNGIASLERENGSEEETIIEFSFLVGADGTKHHAANVLNASEANPHITFLGSDEPGSHLISPGNRQNVFFYGELIRKDNHPFSLPVSQFLVLPGDNLESKRDVFSYYVFYIMLDKNYKKIETRPTRVKFGVGAELPTHLYEFLKTDANHTEKINAVINYIKPYFFERLRRENVDTSEMTINIVKSSLKHGHAKDKMKFGMFDTHIAGAQPVAFAKADKYFALIGDAARKPFFHISHGLNDALYEASWLGKFFRGEIDISKYNALCLARSKEISDYTRQLGTAYTDPNRKWEQANTVEKKVLCDFNSHEPLPATRSTSEIKSLSR